MHSHSRRGFVLTALGGLWPAAGLLGQASLRAAQARSQARTALPHLFDIEKMADGVYAALARPSAITNCNATIFENAADILVVDTHASSTAAASLVAQIQRLIPNKPVRYIVNTHYHGDHVQGGPAYKRVAPRADIIASETTRRMMAGDGGKSLREALEKTNETLDSLKQRAGAAKSPEEKAHWERVARETSAFAAEMKDYAPALPNITLSRDLVIHDKAHDIHIAFRGKGHTSGDVIVFCPQKRVISGGDLLHNTSAYMGDGYPKAWPNTLLEIAGEFDYRIVMGGHGGVHQDRTVVNRMSEYIAELTDQVEQANRRRRTLEQMRNDITPDKLISLRGGYGQLIAGERLKRSLQLPSRDANSLLAEIVRGNIAQILPNLDRT